MFRQPQYLIGEHITNNSLQTQNNQSLLSKKLNVSNVVERKCREAENGKTQVTCLKIGLKNST